MIRINDVNCPICGGTLKYYDSVPRIVRTKKRNTQWVTIRRLKCRGCKSIHRELPTEIVQNKQYSSDIISGVINGWINSDMIGFEEYPCEATMKHWIQTISNIKE